MGQQPEELLLDDDELELECEELLLLNDDELECDELLQDDEELLLLEEEELDDEELDDEEVLLLEDGEDEWDDDKLLLESNDDVLEDNEEKLLEEGELDREELLEKLDEDTIDSSPKLGLPCTLRFKGIVTNWHQQCQSQLEILSTLHTSNIYILDLCTTQKKTIDTPQSSLSCLLTNDS